MPEELERAQGPFHAGGIYGVDALKIESEPRVSPDQVVGWFELNTRCAS